MLCKAALFIFVLHEANHSFVAFRVELGFGFLFCVRNNLIEVSNIEQTQLFPQQKLVPEFVSEVGDEPQSVVQLYVEGLVIVVLPESAHPKFLALRHVAIRTEVSLHSVVGRQLDLPNVFSSKLPDVRLVNELHLVGKLMRAHLSCLKQVYNSRALADMEVPRLIVQVSPQTSNRLIS